MLLFQIHGNLYFNSQSTSVKGDWLTVVEATRVVIFATPRIANHMYWIIFRGMCPAIDKANIPGSLVHPATTYLLCLYFFFFFFLIFKLIFFGSRKVSKMWKSLNTVKKVYDLSVFNATVKALTLVEESGSPCICTLYHLNQFQIQF